MKGWALLWDCGRMAFEELPTVRDLLREADRMLVAEYVAYRASGAAFAVRAGVAGGVTDAVAKAAADAVDEMRTIGPRPSPSASIVLPCRCFYVEGLTGSIGCQIRALRASVSPTRRSGGGEWSAGVDGASDRPLVVEPYRAADWGDVLAYRAWLEAGMSRKERYLFLADLVATMTTFGWTRGAARAGAAAHEAAVRASDARIRAPGTRRAFTWGVGSAAGVASPERAHRRLQEERAEDLQHWARASLVRLRDAVSSSEGGERRPTGRPPR